MEYNGFLENSGVRLFVFSLFLYLLPIDIFNVFTKLKLILPPFRIAWESYFAIKQL